MAPGDRPIEIVDGGRVFRRNPRKKKHNFKKVMARTLLLFLISSILAHSFSPELSRVEPRGGKLGSEIQIQLYGNRLHEPQELLLYHKGLIAEIADAPAKTVKA